MKPDRASPSFLVWMRAHRAPRIDPWATGFGVYLGLWLADLIFHHLFR